jgi:hypothetical protein
LVLVVFYVSTYYDYYNYLYLLYTVYSLVCPPDKPCPYGYSVTANLSIHSLLLISPVPAPVLFFYVSTFQMMCAVPKIIIIIIIIIITKNLKCTALGKNSGGTFCYPR